MNSGLPVISEEISISVSDKMAAVACVSRVKRVIIIATERLRTAGKSVVNMQS